MRMKLNRRSLLKASAIASGGLMLELALPVDVLAEEANTIVSSAELNLYVQPAGLSTKYAVLELRN